MGCSLTQGAVTGRGIGFPYNKSSVFRARAGAVVAGKVYMLAEAVDSNDLDAPEVTAANSQADNGSLANVVPIPAAGAHDMTTDLATFVLALESAGDDGLFRGLVEGYYVDASVTVETQPRPERTPLFLTVTEELTTLQPAGARVPIHGRLLERATANTTASRKVHFNGTPGGFGTAAAS